MAKTHANSGWVRWAVRIVVAILMACWTIPAY